MDRRETRAPVRAPLRFERGPHCLVAIRIEVMKMRLSARQGRGAQATEHIVKQTRGASHLVIQITQLPMLLVLVLALERQRHARSFQPVGRRTPNGVVAMLHSKVCDQE